MPVLRARTLTTPCLASLRVGSGSGSGFPADPSSTSRDVFFTLSLSLCKINAFDLCSIAGNQAKEGAERDGLMMPDWDRVMSSTVHRESEAWGGGDDEGCSQGRP